MENELVFFILAICNLAWLVVVVQLDDYYEAKIKKLSEKKPEVKKVIQTVNVSEKYKDVIREIIPYTLKGKKVAIKGILDKHNIDYVWD